jgi:hypothetical protein
MIAADYTLTSNSGATDEARSMFITLGGTPGAARSVICPAKSKLYFVKNNTAFAQTFKTLAGTGITVPNSGTIMVLYCDGTNVVDAITRLSSLTLGNALLAASGGTGLTAPGTVGNVLTSTGTTWISTAGATGDVTLNGTQTLTNKTIAFANNTLTDVAGTTATQTLTNKTIAFANNTLTDVAGTTATQTLTNKTITNLVFDGNYTEDVYAIVDGASVDLNPANGTVQTWTLGASRSPTATSFAAGQSLTLMIDDGTAYSITWPSVTWKTNAGVAPTLNATGFTAIQLWKVNSTLYGARVGDA